MRKQITITEIENKILCEIKKQSLTLTELETVCSEFSKKVIQASVYSLLANGLVELSDDLKISFCSASASYLVKIQSKPKLVHIENNFTWRSDELLEWAFGQLNEFATYGNFDSIGLAIRFTDTSSYAVFDGDDIMGLAGAVSLLHTSIIDYARNDDE